MNADTKNAPSSHSGPASERQSAEARLMACIQNTPYVAIQWYDEDGRVVFWNAASETVFGWPAQEALGKTLDQLIHTAEEAAAFVRLLQELKAAPRTVGPAEFSFHRKDGSPGVCVSTIFPLPGENGAARFACMDVDVTERKRAEAALRESEARYRAIVEDQTEFIVRWRPDGTRTFVNEAYARYFGQSREEVTGTSFYPLIPEEEREAVRRKVASITPATPIALDEHRARRADGEWRWQQWIDRGFFDAGGRLVELQSVGRDIHERKMAEAALREQQRLLEAAQSAGRVGLWFSDPHEQGRLIWSEETCRIFGFSPGQFDGRVETFFNLVHPGDRAAVHEASRAALEDRRPYQIQHRIIRPDGCVRWVQEQAEVERDAAGNAMRMVGVVRDVTDERQATTLLASEKQALEMIAAGAPLADVLETIVRQVEDQSEGGIGSVLLLEEDGVHVRHGAAPKLPPAFRNAVDGAAIGPQAGSCGTAAFRRETVIVEDIASDPLWTDWRELAQANGLRACWSTPIMSADGRVLATFAVYYRTPRRPSAEEMEWAGRATHLAGIAIERARSETALRRSRADLEQAQSVAHVGSWVSEPGEDGRLLWSDEMHRIAGFEPGTFPGRKSDWFQLVHPDDRAAARAASDAAWSEGRPYVLDHRIIRPDGLVRWVHQHGAIERDASGSSLRMIGVTQDITSRRLAEQNVRKLAAFPQLNPNPVFELAADGSLRYCNAAASRLAAELGHTHVTGMLPDDTPAIVASCLASGNNRTRMERTHGRRVLSWSFYPMAELGVVHCYASDVTERHELEARYRQSQKLESVGQLAAGVAHDFNNLLTIIQGNVSLLRTGAGSPPENAGSLREIEDAAARAANLTRQLLLFSRKQRLDPKPVNLNELTSNLTKMLGRILGEDIRLEFSHEAVLPPVQADPGMIEQAIVNLAVNARDAMPHGGTLRISTTGHSLPDGAPGLPPDVSPGDFVLLAVADNGTGIPPEVLPHIFEPFFTTKDVGKGTGLGLATVYGIVKQHGGWVEVSSQPGRGTEFRIHLPAAARAAQPPDTKPRRETVRGGNETILIVEDEAALREVTRKVLSMQGYTVLSAANGPEALAASRGHAAPIHLLFTDLVMPEGMNGHELATALRRERPALKVIYTSGYSPEMMSGRLRMEPEDAFLQKPYPLDEMFRILRQKLDTVVPSGS